MRTFFVGLIICLCATFLKAEDAVIYRGQSFTIQIGKDVKCKKSTPADFSVYDFSERGKQLFSIYEGFAPSFPTEDVVPPDMKTERINLVRVNIAVHQDPNPGNAAKEYLFKDASEAAHRPMLHVWYGAMPPALMAKVERCIRTIRYQ